MPSPLKNDWKGPGKLFDAVAQWMNRVANFINTLEVEDGELIHTTEPLLESRITVRTRFPFRVAYDGTNATVYDLCAVWWSGEDDKYYNVVATSDSVAVTMPASGKQKCVYCEATLTETAAPTLDIKASADAATSQAAITAATDTATGQNGARRILPLAVINEQGFVIQLWASCWYIGRES